MACVYVCVCVCVCVCVFSFAEKAEDLMGRQMDIICLPYFPYMSYKVVQNGSGSTLQMEDSLNSRMLATLAQHMNFT